MANENLDTTNKLIKPDNISPSDDAIIRQLSDNLQDITPEDVDAICDEIDEAEVMKKGQQEAKDGNGEKKFEIPQQLADFRKMWEKKINLDDDKKKVIIDAVDKIPHKATIESD